MWLSVPSTLPFKLFNCVDWRYLVKELRYKTSKFINLFFYQKGLPIFLCFNIFTIFETFFIRLCHCLHFFVDSGFTMLMISLLLLFLLFLLLFLLLILLLLLLKDNTWSHACGNLIRIPSEKTSQILNDLKFLCFVHKLKQCKRVNLKLMDFAQWLSSIGRVCYHRGYPVWEIFK